METTQISCASCGARNRVPIRSSGSARCGRCHHDLAWIAEVGGALDDVLATSPVPVLVDLWAEWCGPCRAVAPALEQLAVERTGRLRVAKVDVDAAPEVSARLGVQGIPTMVLYRDGVELGRQVGALPAHAIASWVDSTLSGGGRR